MLRTLVLVAGLVVMALPAWPAEQRCDELGANCICSEPMNTNQYTTFMDGYFNPSDSSVKECTFEVAGYPVYRSGLDLVFDNNATVLSRLPSGHSVNYFPRQSDGGQGIWFAGHVPGSLPKRYAMRAYLYYSDDKNGPNFDGSNGCNNKMGIMGGPTGSVTGHHMLDNMNWGSWTMIDGPDANLLGPDSGAIPFNDWRGKWWRVEFVMVNADAINTGQTFRLITYVKNLTTGIEYNIADTAYDGRFSGFVPNQVLTYVNFNLYGAPYGAGGPEAYCDGYRGISHLMVAGWDTDAGQRIGAAYEVEAGGGPTPPGAPQNLRFVEWLILIGLGAMMTGCLAYAAMGLVAIVRARHERVGRVGGMGGDEIRGAIPPPPSQPVPAADRDGRGTLPAGEDGPVHDADMAGAGNQKTLRR